ncbi:MAG: hypothetical protein J1F16_04020 [Muribaculaceae bacterium]|nr:hypothetical protein [Muribaculaceae bacterium]
MSLSKAYLRWRHSKGFGIHSPYAYRFVTDVLRPGRYGLYSYEKIDSLLRDNSYSNHSIKRWVRFIVRLAVFLKSSRIVSNRAASVMSKVAAKALNIHYTAPTNPDKFKFKEGDLFITEGGETEASLLDSAIKNGVPVFAVNPTESVRTILEQPLENGMLLRDKERLILIPRKEMAYVAYDIRLKAL